MLGTQRILSQAAQAEDKPQQQLLQQLLVPFVSFVLLHRRPDDTGKHNALCKLQMSTMFDMVSSNLVIYCHLGRVCGDVVATNLAACCQSKLSAVFATVVGAQLSLVQQLSFVQTQTLGTGTLQTGCTPTI